MGRPWSFDRNDFLKWHSAGWGGGPVVWRSDMQMLERGDGGVVGRRNPLLEGVLVLLILVSMARAQLDILAQKVNPYIVVIRSWEHFLHSNISSTVIWGFVSPVRSIMKVSCNLWTVIVMTHQLFLTLLSAWRWGFKALIHLRNLLTI